MMKRNIGDFFDLLGLLSQKEVNSLEHFARVSILKSSKKAICLLALIKDIPKGDRKTSKNINLLRRKLYPNDETGRYFQRILNEAEEILRCYIAFRELQKQPTVRQLLLLEGLPLPSFEEEFKGQLGALKRMLEDSSSRSSRYSLDCYRYELSHEKLIAQQKDKNRTHNHYATLEHLDRFYLLEKLKYAIVLKLWSNIYREEPNASLIRQIEFLIGQFRENIEVDPILKIYVTAYRLYHGEVSSQQVIALLNMLMKNEEILHTEELNNLYTLVSNFYINKINSKRLSASELKEAYLENFKLVKFQSEEDMLREGEYIPYGRFQNVISAAVATGTPENLDWAECFLKEKISMVRPGERRIALEKFNQGAIHFYRGEFEKCFKVLEDVPYSNRFYYCDIKSLRLRAQFESSQNWVDYVEEIQNIKKIIRNDKSLSRVHRQGYLNFFELIKQLFKSCDEGKPGREVLKNLKTKVQKTHPVAKKEWLLEKVQELEGP